MKESRRRTTSRPRPGRPDPEGAGGRQPAARPGGMSPSGLQRTPEPVGVLESTNCRTRGIPPPKDRGPRGLVKRQGPLETAPRGHVQGSRIRWRRRPGPAPGVSGQSSAAGPWPTVYPPPTRHLAARDLREIRALIRTLQDARSRVATASADGPGGPTLRHARGHPAHEAWCESVTPRPRRRTGHPVHELENQASPMAPAGLLRPAARWYVPAVPGCNKLVEVRIPVRPEYPRAHQRYWAAKYP